MGERALQNRVLKLLELERQQEELKERINGLKEQIKQDMEKKGVEELQVGSFFIRWKVVISSRFDAKAFQKEHESLYSQYVKQISSRRFTVA